MRMGAIFARGSCRALKWMALLGAVLAMAVGQAVAQPQTSSVFEPGTQTVTVVMNEAVYGTPPLTSFTFEVDADGGNNSYVANVVTGFRYPQGSPSTTFELTVTTAIKTGSDARLAYTVPATSPLKAADDNANVAAWTSDSGDIGEKDILPTLERVEDMELPLDQRLSPRSLPEGERGNGNLVHTLTIVSSTATGVSANTAVPASATGASGGLAFIADPPTIIGTPSVEGVHSMRYTVTDRAISEGDTTTNNGQPIARDFKITVEEEDPGPTPTGTKGQITEFKLVGDVVDKTIAGIRRHHVPEGSQGVDLSVTVQWTHEEIAAIGYYTPQTIGVEIMSDRGTRPLPNWLSWVDTDGQDVHFPRTAGYTGTVTVRTPRASEIPNATKGSPRHVMSKTGTLDVLILHDDHEAENDAFYIEATSGDVNLGNIRGATSRTTLDVVIEDDEQQTVRIRNSRYLGAPTNVYEPAGDPEITNPVFHVDAQPNRNDLPLEVRLDVVDLNDQTVSAAKISLDKAAMTLNSGSIGDSDSVTVHLPASDGNRVDDGYKLNASVNVYSVATGGYVTIPVAEHAFTVIDRHKLPDLTVSPATATVKEGGKTELTLTINRNPSDTFVGAAAINSNRKEKRQYTDEEVSIMLTMGTGSTAGASDYSIMPASVTFPARTRGAYTASMTAEVTAMSDNELDDMEMLVLNAGVTGAVAANGTDKDTHAGVSTLTISDGTVKQVEPETDANVKKAVDDAVAKGAGDEGLNPTESFSVKVTDLFKEVDGYAVDYDVSVSGDAVTADESNGNVVVRAAKVGESTVTVTAKASMSMSSAVATRQTSADSAEVDFDVVVVNKKLMVTVSAEPMTVEEGGTSEITATVEGRAVHADDGTVRIDLTVDGDATLEASSITIPAGQMKGSVTLTATDDDDYDDETVTVTYSGSGIDGQKQLTISVTDPDEATPTVRAKTDAAAKIAAAIKKAAGNAEWVVGGMVAEVEMDGLFDLDEGVTATYQGTSSDADVVRAMTTGNTLMLTPMGAGTATITVTGADTAGGSEAAVVTHDATVVLANLTMTVTVEPMAVEEGGMATITAKASRMVAMSDGMVKVNLSVVGDATLSAEMIEIKADSDTGTATLTSTDDEVHEPDGEKVTLIASGAGIDGNVSFDIIVTDNDAAPVDTTYTLSGPADMNIAEGGSATLTATASAAVEADTEIMIMRDGASTASDADYTAGSITIKAGETTGTTMVTAVEDNEPDSGSGMPEMLTLYGMVGNMQTNSVTFNIWDAAVPALPAIAQLLLAAFLAVGGYRRYLRR